MRLLYVFFQQQNLTSNIVLFIHGVCPPLPPPWPRPSLLGLQVFEHLRSAADLEGVGAAVLRHGAALDEQLLDLAVIDDGTVAPRALAEAALRVPRA